MSDLSKLLQNLSESATLAMARRSRELAAQGYNVVSLSLGEPDFNTPDFIKEAAKKAIDDNYSHYPPVNGYLELRKSIALKFKRDNGLEYSPDQIVVSTGAKQSIMNAVLALVDPGDEVVLPAPYWVSYIEMVKLAGGIPVVVESTVEQEYKISAAQLRAAMSDKTKLIIFSSPCNPSGAVFSKSELEGFAEVMNDFPRSLIISDEIYELINFGEKHFSIAALPGMYERTITVNGVSKGFAMTGWRIGYIGAPQWIASACTKIQGQFTSAASSIAQMATKAAVEADPEVVQSMREAFYNRRELVINRLRKISGLKCPMPGGAFYAFPDVSEFFGKSDGSRTVNTAEELCNYLLDTEYLALVSGEAFGTKECIRISYAASEKDLNEAIDRLERALARLK